MKEKNKNEKMQSRRQFFKSASRIALPILGAALWVNVPIITKAAELEPAMGTPMAHVEDANTLALELVPIVVRAHVNGLLADLFLSLPN